MNISQAEIPACISVGQTLMVEPEQVKHGRMEVVHMDRFLDGLETEGVGCTVNVPGFHSTPAIQTVKPW